MSDAIVGQCGLIVFIDYYQGILVNRSQNMMLSQDLYSACTSSPSAQRSIMTMKPCLDNSSMKAVVINPDYDEYTEFLCHTSKEILTTAEKGGYSTTCLGSLSATRSCVELVLKEIGDDEAIIVFYGHGDIDCLYGAHHEPIINRTNVTLLRNKVIYAVASFSGRSLGPLAINCGALSYFGYTDNLLFYFGDNAPDFQSSLMHCLNAGVKKVLLEHCSGKEAFKAMYDEYTKWYDYWLTRNFNAALALFHNRESLVYYGG